MADNAVLQASILRLETQLSSAHNHLNELYDGHYIPRDVEIKQRENDRLSKAHDEVEILQKQKNKVEEDLCKSQDAKERLENTLKKVDIEFMKMKTCTTKAEGQVTLLQEELDRSRVNGYSIGDCSTS